MAKKVVDKEKLAKVTKKGKGFMGEFKEFIMRGNVMDMAIGVIIGGAFGTIINSLVSDILMPLISLATGGVNFEKVDGAFLIVTSRKRHS